MKIRVIELFGGIGACSEAIKRLGIKEEIVDYVEIDKYAVKSFNAINGTNFEPQDITKWDKDFKDIDLIMHGSPCQDFSIAGLQAGGNKDSGTRSSLMYESIRIINKIKPKYVIWENVKNLLSAKHKPNFEKYLETLDNYGYNNYYKVLNAKDFGIPQNDDGTYRYLEPWHMTDNEGRLDLTFSPRIDRVDDIAVMGIVKSVQHQVFGTLDGQVTMDDGTVLQIRGLNASSEHIHNRY